MIFTWILLPPCLKSVADSSRCKRREEQECFRLAGCRSCFLNSNCQWEPQQQECQAMPGEENTHVHAHTTYSYSWKVTEDWKLFHTEVNFKKSVWLTWQSAPYVYFGFNAAGGFIHTCKMASRSCMYAGGEGRLACVCRHIPASIAARGRRPLGEDFNGSSYYRRFVCSSHGAAEPSARPSASLIVALV